MALAPENTGKVDLKNAIVLPLYLALSPLRVRVRVYTSGGSVHVIHYSRVHRPSGGRDSGPEPPPRKPRVARMVRASPAGRLRPQVGPASPFLAATGVRGPKSFRSLGFGMCSTFRQPLLRI